MVTNQQLMQQRADAADLMITELNAPPAPAADNEPAPDAVEADDAAQPTTVETDASLDQGAAPVDTPSPVPAVGEVEIAALQTEVAELKDKLAKSDQRYSTLQGMLNARNQDINELRGVIATLSVAPPAAEPAPIVSDKDVETYGEDMIDLINRVVKQQVAPLITEVDSRVSTVANATSANAARQFEADLSDAVPNWETINDSPEFVAWLGTYRVKALNEAYSAYDLAATAQFFMDYEKLNAPAPTASLEPAAPAATDKLAHLAAPTRGKVAPPVADTRGKVWTGTEVSKLYRDFAEKRISKADFDKLEADLFKAQKDGRIAA
jgi:hypothetical protein